ncbi:MAG: hypothetical protein J5374_05310 [Bacteroidales bacterium]|jgi:hypothetical protein|nr:hypothetical protein [Bacteroidales bacterium]
MKKQDLCDSLKAALENQYGWSIDSMELQDETFTFCVDNPESGIFWTGDEDEIPEEGIIVPGLHVDGFGEGCVLCWMPLSLAIRHFLPEVDDPLEDKVRKFFAEEYADTLEVLSVEPDEDNDWDIPTVFVRTRLLPGKTFVNKRALNIDSIEGDVMVFQIEDFDLDDTEIEDEEE